MSEYMNPPEAEPEKICVRHRKELSGSIYALLFLFVTTYGLHRALAVYLDRLLHRGHISRWTFLVGYEQTGMAAVFLVELAIVMCLYRLGPLRMSLREMGVTFAGQKWKGLVWGLVAGLLVSVASLPLLKFDRYSDLTDLIIRDLFHPRIVLVVILLVILLPVGTEIVFRGIVFKSFVESSSLVPALLLNALVFALVWPIFNAITGFLLGFTTALLYHRFRSVTSGVVANAVLTIAYAATLVSRRLL